jgi:hypothetical protein
MPVFTATATTNGSVVSVKITPTDSASTSVKWVRQGVRSRIGGTTVQSNGTSTFHSYTNADNGGIPVGKAYIYVGEFWYDAIDFSSLVGQNITVDTAGVGPQSPAEGNVDSWDGSTLVVTIVSGSFTNRTNLDKITYGY